MIRKIGMFAALGLLMCLLLCFTASSASAATANSVNIYGAVINAATPYWTNDGHTHSAEPAVWNAWFDAATGTLTLNNLSIHEDISAYGNPVIFVLGDIVLNLIGNNEIVTVCAPTGVVLRCLLSVGTSSSGANDGDVTIVGSGQLTLQTDFAPTGIPSGMNAFMALMEVDGHLLVDGGTLNVLFTSSDDPQVSCEGITLGAWDTHDRMTVAGGSVTIQGYGMNISLLEVLHGDFTMTGGRLDLTATVNKDGMAQGLMVFGGNFRMTGGVLDVTCKSYCGMSWIKQGFALSVRKAIAINGGIGALMSNTDYTVIQDSASLLDRFTISGGHFIFGGAGTAALYLPTPVLMRNDVRAIVDDNSPHGFDKWWWNDSMPPLANNYYYVEFVDRDPYPQTGDTFNLPLWLGLGFTALLGLGALARKRKRA